MYLNPIPESQKSTMQIQTIKNESYRDSTSKWFRHLSGRKYLTHRIGQKKSVFYDYVTWNASNCFFIGTFQLEYPHKADPGPVHFTLLERMDAPQCDHLTTAQRAPSPTCIIQSRRGHSSRASRRSPSKPVPDPL